MRISNPLIMLLLAAVFGGCAQQSDQSKDARSGPAATSVAVAPASLERAPGDTFQFSATARYSDGSSSDVTARADWRVADTGVATVDNNASKGLVSFVAAGTTTLTASYGGLSGQAGLTASTTAPTLTAVAIAPASLVRAPGDTFQFSATAQYSDGSSGDVSAQADWQVANSGVATVDNNASKGLVSFVAAGSTTLTATYGGLSGQATVSVQGPSGSMGPLHVSSRNPRYFENPEGKIVFLTGSHTWPNLQDAGMTDPPAPFDYDTWLNFIDQYDHNFFRLWTWEQATWTLSSPARWNISPVRYLRTGPGVAIDGKPKFDLTQFNPAYFDRLRQRVIEAGQRGMYVSIMLFNGWSVASSKGSHSASNPWLGHPYNGSNNINGINGDTNGDNSGTETHEIGVVDDLQQAYVREVIDSVNDLDNVLYEISNESHAGSVNWQYAMIQFIRDYEATKPKQHPIGMTVPWPDGQNSSVLSSSADWVSLNGSLDNPPVATGAKVIIADTDHLCGMCGSREWAWKSFTRGENPIFMDTYIDIYDSVDYDLNNPQDVSLRQNLGYIRSYANRIDLAQAVPAGSRCSTNYCLGYASAAHAEYVVYAPTGGTITVDLSNTSAQLTVEWFNPANGSAQAGGTVAGGSPSQSFQPPFAGDAVLYLTSEVP